MSQANQGQNIIAERLRVQGELAKNEQFLCPANPNHQLVSLDRLKCHLNTCKEIKQRAHETQVYFCQFYEGHMYLIREERDTHERNCSWKLVPGNPPHDPNANRFIVIKGNGPPPGSRTLAHPATQKNHYEYALRKGLVKEKCKREQPNEGDFVFVREPQRINLEIEQRYSVFQTNFDLSNLLTLVDAREESDLTDLEFMQSNQKIEFMQLQDWMATCLQHGIPYNQYFKENHTTTLIKRNEYQQAIRQLQSPVSQFKISCFIPTKVIYELIQNHFPITDYDTYLRDLITEVKVRPAQDKYQKEFMNSLHETTKFHPKYKCSTSFLDLTHHGRLTVIMPNTKENLHLSQFPSRQTDLIIYSFKISKPEIVDLIRPYMPSNQKLQFFSSQKPSQSLTNENEQIQKVEASNQLQQQLAEEKLRVEIDQFNQYIEDYGKRISQKQKSITEQKAKTYQFSQQASQLMEKSQSAICRQKNQEAALQAEFKKINIQTRQMRQQQFTKTVNAFETLKVAAIERIKKAGEQAKAYREQIDNQRLQNSKRLEAITKLQQRVRKSEREQKTIREEMALRADTEEHQSDQAFKISNRILCKICNKNRVNILYLGCQHAVCCQICFNIIENSGIRQCLQCNLPYEKVRHILWEGGYTLGANDVIVGDKSL